MIVRASLGPVISHTPTRKKNTTHKNTTQWEDALNSFKAKLAKGQDVFGPLIK